MSSPEEVWMNLIKRDGLTPHETAASSFSALKPVTADFLTRGKGEWQGGEINTGHPARSLLTEMNWAGKVFRTAEDVDPVIVYDEAGKRKWNPDWGRARLREIKFQDRNTVAMVYDDFPIIDFFKYVSEDVVAGAMDSKAYNSDGIFYFYLKRL